MEIEAKFRIDDPASFAALLALDQLGPYTLTPEALIEQQHNSYYDTADGRLRTARSSVRIRRIGARSIVTVKGPNHVENGLHQRAEWEVEAATPDPHSWPESAARQEALKLLGDGAALQHMLTIETARRHIIVARDGQAVVECSLDEGVIYVAGRSEHFRELELELLPAGTRADLDALMAALAAHLPLVPENQSKLERGLALLDE